MPFARSRFLERPEPLAGAAFLAASWCLLDVGPLRVPQARQLTLVLAALLGLLLSLAALGPSRRWMAVALSALLASSFGAPPEWTLAVSIAGAWWSAERSAALRGSLASAAAGLAAAAAARTLARSFEPGGVEAWLDAALFGWLPAGTFASAMGASAGGMLLLPVGLAALTARGLGRGAWLVGALVLVACAYWGRFAESAWPLAIGAILPPLIEPRRLGAGHASALDRQRLAAASWGVSLATLLVCAGLASWRGPTRVPKDRAPVVGFVAAMHGTFERPALEPSDGADGLPRFGEFRRLLERVGARTVDLTTPEDLARTACDALVTINLSGEGTLAWIEPLRSRIREGARLLVLADHTDLFGQLEPTAALLAGTGIALAFDSAVPRSVTASWTGSLQAARDELFGPSRDGAGIGWSVGCSLAVRAPATVRAIGTHAFLDRGVREKPGGLGDLRRAPDETLGGFPIAASSRLGAGEVLVFGDTSALQDLSLVGGREFARRVAAWLCGAPSARAALRAGLGALFGVVLALLCAFVVLAPRAALVGLTLLLAVESGFDRPRAAATPEREHARDALAMCRDFAAGVPPAAEESLDALFEAATALGWSPQLESEVDAEQPGATLVVEPLERLERSEVDGLLARCEAGGALVVLCGPRGAEALEPLFDALGLTLSTPLGRGLESAWEGPLADRSDRPSFRSSFELGGHGLARASVLASAFERPVAVSGRHGSGRWLIVGDAELARSKHADPRRGGSLAGARSLGALLGTVLTREQSE